MLKNFMHPSSSQTDSRQPASSAADANRFKQPAYPSTKSTEAAKTESIAAAAPTEDGNKLIVGPNIKLKGSEITDCEILVVEGRVEASMNSRDIRIAEGGVFSGKAEIDVAEVHGTFEGELTARKRLVIYATGKVSGVIRYGAMMVEEGGTISGDVATLAAGTSVAVAKVSEIAPQTTAPESDHGDASKREPAPFVSTLARTPVGKRQN